MVFPTQPLECWDYRQAPPQLTSACFKHCHTFRTELGQQMVKEQDSGMWFTWVKSGIRCFPTLGPSLVHLAILTCFSVDYILGTTYISLVPCFTYGSPTLSWKTWTTLSLFSGKEIKIKKIQGSYSWLVIIPRFFPVKLSYSNSLTGQG